MDWTKLQRTTVGAAVAVMSQACFSEPSSDRRPGSTTRDESVSSTDASDTGQFSIDTSSSTGTGAANSASTGRADGSTTEELHPTSTGAEGSTTTSSGESSSDASSTTMHGTDTDAGTTTSTNTDTDTDESGTTAVDPVDLADLVEGDIIITEVMWNPECSNDDCEWFEVYNTTEYPVNLRGLVVTDFQANTGRISNDVIAPPHGFALFARRAQNWPYQFDYDDLFGPSLALTNSGLERLPLSNAAGILDRTPFFPADTPSGTSWGVLPDAMDAVDNDRPENWCLSNDILPTNLVGAVEYGTPKAQTGACALGVE